MRMHALFGSSVRFSRALLFVGLILFSCVGAREAAAEVIVKVDSIAPGVPLVVEGGYPAGRFGNVLTSPVDGKIVGVQIWWGSPQGNSSPSLQPAIRISTFNVNSAFSPTTIAQINSPTLIDGELNEFRFTDPGTNLIPLSVPITAGAPFFVDLEVANSTPEPEVENAPFILIDKVRTAGGLLNFAAFEGGSRWQPFTMGIFGGGEMGIRAIIQPVPEPSTYALAAIGVVALATAKRRNVFRFSRALLFVGLILFSCVSAREVAAETVVADSLSGLNIRMVGTKEGDRFAARLTAPTDGNIVGVQIFWGSTSGTFGATQEAAIRISAADGQAFDGTTIPQPGTVLATIVSPVLVDQQKFGAATTPNEFRFLDPGTDQAPVNVPVLAGQSFYVELETITAYSLLSADAPGVYGSLVNRPFDLYQSIIHAPDNSALLPSSAYWHEIREAFLSQSSWGIRAIIQPVPEPSTYALAAMGVVAILAVSRRKH